MLQKEAHLKKPLQKNPLKKELPVNLLRKKEHQKEEDLPREEGHLKKEDNFSYVTINKKGHLGDLFFTLILLIFSSILSLRKLIL